MDRNLAIAAPKVTIRESLHVCHAVLPELVPS